VDIHIDEYPEDVSWTIRKNSKTGDTVASGGNYKTKYALESEFVDLRDDAEYFFVIEDEYGDGLGSDGQYTIVEVNEEGKDGNTLVSGGGDFRLQSKSFTVRGPPTETPPPSNATSFDENTELPSVSPNPLPPTTEDTTTPTKDPTNEKSTDAPTEIPSEKGTPAPTKKVETDAPTGKETPNPTNLPAERKHHFHSTSLLLACP
jgi:hypothetical protein